MRAAQVFRSAPMRGPSHVVSRRCESHILVAMEAGYRGEAVALSGRTWLGRGAGRTSGSIAAARACLQFRKRPADSVPSSGRFEKKLPDVPTFFTKRVTRSAFRCAAGWPGGLPA